jgi:hypothetical protein
MLMCTYSHDVADDILLHIPSVVSKHDSWTRRKLLQYITVHAVTSLFTTHRSTSKQTPHVTVYTE